MTARWMGLSRPVIVSATPENAGLPLAGCPRVSTGTSEEEELAALMLWLAGSPVRRRECGRAAGDWAAKDLQLAAISQQYWAVLESVAPVSCNMLR
jgi:hypothetical protein